ncbi:heavy metal translocating P-type ATPase [soil metagenome]
MQSVEVLLSAERASVTCNSKVDVAKLRAAVEGAGYKSPIHEARDVQADEDATSLTRTAMTLMGLLFGVVLFVVVVGEWLGLFGALTARVPWWLGSLLVLAFGYPIFKNVLRNALKGRVISHTLMSTGAVAALATGEWATAAVVVFFMRVGDYAEKLTTERARGSLKDLSALAPRTARVERAGETLNIPVEQVDLGDTVVVRPGEHIPVDGTVMSGQATVNQATLTGESMPTEVGEGSPVYAATLAQLGSLRVKTTAVGRDTTFGKVIRQVEQAEANRGEVQTLADKFSAWYLPVVAAIALLTYLIGGDLLAAVAVTVVACSCAFALATPVAMLASIGAAARRGLLVKGGKSIEALAKADVLLVDKTGTLTLGKPELTNVISLGSLSEDELLTLAAAAERDSEHPLAEAVRQRATSKGLAPRVPETFEALPGRGVRARVGDRIVEVGSSRLLGEVSIPAAQILEAEGKTLLFVLVDGEPAGVLAAADTLRWDVPAALEAVGHLGIKHVELLTGDNEHAARAVADRLGIRYQANLLPEDKLAVVRAYQAKGHTVVMVGDGVNDAPALVQADVGVAMGAVGTDIARDSARLILMRDDWALVPEALRIARRTMGVVKLNIGFTAVYNVVGITLAALGLLPPIFAAALQSIPDLGIMANSARLLRQPQPPSPKVIPPTAKVDLA